MAAQLTAPNRAALWLRLALNKSQLAELCGVTVRQIGHWTKQGYIRPSDPANEHFNGAAIERVLLIKQGLDQGLPLRSAVARAEAFLAQAQEAQPDLQAIEPVALDEIQQELQAALGSLARVLEVVEPLVSHDGAGEPQD